ncbi:MAG: D-glycero-beta-D-manno-heptose 1-phosphate adenylyltransferase [Sphingobacteriia bacterium]|jgi:rfaE bifunctional protein nucleotidyltransferase chain/domain|nr:D-glycero-beta-D-manno-heptose 1-phosphate adenylyltransferase [Sphingobacteriia bacterium]
MAFHKQLKDKIISAEMAQGRMIALRGSGKKVVFTNGCFDLLHPGHVDYLAQARDLGDYLVLGLNTDASVRLLDKAPGRPYNSEKTRAQVLAGLACVDAIIFFDEETPYQLIQFLEPDVLVKGNDYRVDQIAGFDLVQKRGGKVVTIPLLEGYSTTALVTKIKSH